jgi:predicted NBD/HSP70 family sugar kinase
MLGLGVGVPGVVDADRGVVLRSTPFQAIGVELKQMLAERFGVTTLIDHDACLGAAAEAIEGAARGLTHFLYFSVNHNPIGGPAGVRFDSYGSALYLEGKVYRGAHYGAGELVSTLAPATVDATEAELASLAEEEGELSEGMRGLAVGIGRSLSSIMNLIDLQMVVLAGTARVSNRAFLGIVQGEMERTSIRVPGRVVRIVPTLVRSEAVARGAAIVASDAAFADPKFLGFEGAGVLGG